MAELHNYETVVNGVQTTLRLSSADAKKRGLTRKQVVVVVTDPPENPPPADPPAPVDQPPVSSKTTAPKK